MTNRISTTTRSTSETQINIAVNLDGTGEAKISTGIGFLDHMLTALAKHSGIDIALTCKGDLYIDDHHTAEDCALALGEALNSALADRRGIARFGSAYAPLDESLVRAVIDLSGRPFGIAKLDLRRETLGTLSCENIPHFFMSLAQSLRAAIHIDLIRGENDHHKAEAAFKALALALQAAIARTGIDQIPSTKGSL